MFKKFAYFVLKMLLNSDSHEMTYRQKVKSFLYQKFLKLSPNSCAYLQLWNFFTKQMKKTGVLRVRTPQTFLIFENHNPLFYNNIQPQNFQHYSASRNGSSFSIESFRKINSFNDFSIINELDIVHLKFFYQNKWLYCLYWSVWG